MLEVGSNFPADDQPALIGVDVEVVVHHGGDDFVATGVSEFSGLDMHGMTAVVDAVAVQLRLRPAVDTLYKLALFRFP